MKNILVTFCENDFIYSVYLQDGTGIPLTDYCHRILSHIASQGVETIFNTLTELLQRYPDAEIIDPIEVSKILMTEELLK